MLEWLFSTKYLLIPPPQFVESGTLINGNLFPKNVSGFVRFNYNETFKNIPWNSIKSHWKGKKIFWNRGKIEQFDGIKEIIVKNTGTPIHPCWKKIGYFPCYWRSAKIIVDTPVGMNPLDAWPISKYEIKEDVYIIVFSGEISVHEICQPIANKPIFEHQILVNPTQVSKIARYYKNEDFMVNFINQNGKLLLEW